MTQRYLYIGKQHPERRWQTCIMVCQPPPSRVTRIAQCTMRFDDGHEITVSRQTVRNITEQNTDETKLAKSLAPNRER